jgi:hypothetical protein
VKIRRTLPMGFMVLTLAAAGACGQRSDEASTIPAPPPADAGKTDPESPKAGTNTGRPDSMKDLKPEPGLPPQPAAQP